MDDDNVGNDIKNGNDNDNVENDNENNTENENNFDNRIDVLIDAVGRMEPILKQMKKYFINKNF